MAKALPYDAELEWIGVRQGSCIQTDFVPTGIGISVEMLVRFQGYPTPIGSASSNYAMWYSARNDANGLAYRVIRSTANTALLIANANIDSKNTTFSFTPAAETLYYLNIDTRAITIRGVEQDTAVGSYTTTNTTHTGDTNTTPLTIGDNSNNRGTNLDIYTFTVRKDGVVVLDLIPVRIGQVGFVYDKISGKLHGKKESSTEELVLGPDKRLVPEVTNKFVGIRSLQYLWGKMTSIFAKKETADKVQGEYFDE